VLLVGACSQGSSDTKPPERPSPDATISFSGSRGLAGRATDPSVRCNWPDLEGLSIAVLAQPPDASSLARIRLRLGNVQVVIGSGEGPEYHERAFEGTGVTSFDAAKGARVDSTLTETRAAPGSTGENVGAVTSIRASVECGDQTPGRSTVTITGETPIGAVAAATLDPVRVECDATPDGDEVAASGLIQVGSTEALLSLGLSSDGAVTVNKTSASASRQYRAFGTSTITATGAHVRADVVEEGASPGGTLHVEGDLSCGRNAAG